MLKTYECLHFNNLQPTVEFRHEVRGPREGDSTCANKTIIERGILSDSLSEWSPLHKKLIKNLMMGWCLYHLEIDRKSRNLLRESDQVDSCIEQIGLELGLQVNRASSTER